jgi:MFS family permease
MFSRYRDLQRVSDGYGRSGLPMVAYDGTRFLPAGPSDDLGLYFIVPWMSRILHISLERAIAGFLLSALGLGVVVGSAGLLLSLRSTVGKIISVSVLFLLSGLAYWVGDIYIFEFAAFAALFPWIWYFMVCKVSSGKTLCFFLGTLGAIAGVLFLIRLGSAPALLGAAGVLVLFYLNAPINKKVGLIAILLLGFFAPQLYLRHVTERADNFLTANDPSYHTGDSRHVFWHVAYIGLGFLSNPYVPGGVCDEVAKDKVEALSPGTHYCSLEYDRLLQHEVFSITQEHSHLVLFNIFAKLGIIAGMIILFANVGLVAAFLYPKPWLLELAFWSGLILSAAPLVVLAPLPMYSLGVITLAVVYGLISLDYAIAKRREQPISESPAIKERDQSPVLALLTD